MVTKKTIGCGSACKGKEIVPRCSCSFFFFADSACVYLWQLLAQRCNCRDALELSNFMLLKGWFSFHEGNADKTIAHLQFDVVTMATVFKATPINMVPIVPTALAKNLSGPHSLSQVQGRPKSGYVFNKARCGSTFYSWEMCFELILLLLPFLYVSYF